MGEAIREQAEVPLYFGLTPNQVVAYNLAQARLLKGWTQDQACEALEPHLGSSLVEGQLQRRRALRRRQPHPPVRRR